MYFLCKAHHSLLGVGNILDRTSALSLGAILNSKIPTTSTQLKTKQNMALNRPRKAHLFTLWEMKPQGCVALWRIQTLGDLDFLPPYAFTQMMRKHREYWFGGYK